MRFRGNTDRDWEAWSSDEPVRVGRVEAAKREAVVLIKSRRNMLMSPGIAVQEVVKIRDLKLTQRVSALYCSPQILRKIRLRYSGSTSSQQSSRNASEYSNEDHSGCGVSRAMAWNAAVFRLVPAEV